MIYDFMRYLNLARTIYTHHKLRMCSWARVSMWVWFCQRFINKIRRKYSLVCDKTIYSRHIQKIRSARVMASVIQMNSAAIGRTQLNLFTNKMDPMGTGMRERIESNINANHKQILNPNRFLFERRRPSFFFFCKIQIHAISQEFAMNASI